MKVKIADYKDWRKEAKTPIIKKPTREKSAIGHNIDIEDLIKENPHSFWTKKCPITSCSKKCFDFQPSDTNASVTNPHVTSVHAAL